MTGVLSLLGRGSFGCVVRAYDPLRQQEVAVKIVKSRRGFLARAKAEAELVAFINAADPEDKMHCVRLLDQFTIQGTEHRCLVFEKLSGTLYGVLRNTGFLGVSLHLTRLFARQLLEALAFLARPEIDVVHADIKPENILLVHTSGASAALKLIDFGCSASPHCTGSKTLSRYVQSRYYRAPEVALGVPRPTRAIDVWSTGCVLAELHTGRPLFPARTEEELVARVAALLGLPPHALLCRGSRTQIFFEVVPVATDGGGHRSVFLLKQASGGGKGGAPAAQAPVMPAQIHSAAAAAAKARAARTGALERLVGADTGGPHGLRAGEPGHAPGDYRRYADLLQRMLCLDPARRIAPGAALRLPFFTAATAAPAPPPVKRQQGDKSSNKQKDADAGGGGVCGA